MRVTLTVTASFTNNTVREKRARPSHRRSSRVARGSSVAYARLPFVFVIAFVLTITSAATQKCALALAQHERLPAFLSQMRQQNGRSRGRRRHTAGAKQ